MGAKRDYPRYNHVHTRLHDDDYDAMRAFSRAHNISHAKAAESLIVLALRMMGVNK